MTSNEDSISVGYSGIDDFVMFENNATQDKNLGDDIYSSDSNEDRSYLNKAYAGKIYDEPNQGRITLERGMLFANVDTFREVLGDFVHLGGF